MDKRISEINERNQLAFIGGAENTEDGVLDRIVQHVRAGGKLFLFLDYDGTLVPYAPTPDQAVPDDSLIDLLSKLAHVHNLHVVVLSGRPLFSLEKMLPIPGLELAGLYGVEVESQNGTLVRRVDYEPARKVVDEVKNQWAQLINGRAGFLLEDKGMAVALHSRLASRDDAKDVAPRAHSIAARTASDRMRILGGEDFIEVAPAVAHKGSTVTWLLAQDQPPPALPVYFGDDDKDEEAFQAILSHGGIPIIVGGRQPNTQALARLRSPTVVHNWLTAILSAAETKT